MLQDAYAKQLKPLYNYMHDMPALENAQIPVLKRDRVRRTGRRDHEFLDAAARLPLPVLVLHHHQCAGPQVAAPVAGRHREDHPHQHGAGAVPPPITDDTARNKDWEAILDRLIHLREVDKLEFSFLIQVDTLCHKLPNFIAKAARAGVTRVYIGLENINPVNLIAAKKRQNKITEYRKMLLLAWQKAGVLCYAGYITGFPGDTAESILRDIDVLKRELPVDVLEIFYLTPLPGSEDHQKLHRAGIWMDPDLNKYDLYHITTKHPKMTTEEWEHAYWESWRRYYSYEHCATIMRRSAALRAFGSTLFALTWFKGCLEIENVHPVEGGVLRMKSRRDRRSTFPMEPVWKFYPRFWAETASKVLRWGWTYARLRKIYLSRSSMIPSATSTSTLRSRL